MDADREGKHEIALVGKKILIKPADHHHDRKDDAANQQKYKQHPEQGVEHVENGREGTRAVVDHGRADAQEAGEQDDHQKQRQHPPCRRAEFMFHQFSQHRNTSLK